MKGAISRRALLATGLLAAARASGFASEPASVAAAVAQSNRWPLRVSQDRSHFVDGSDVPVLLVGDTAWSLMAVLTRSETQRYLESRAQLGVNVFIANLVEHQFSSHEPPARNAAGDLPFANNDFSRPNPRYFEHAEWVIGQALARNMGVLLAPAYLGFQCGEQGWCDVMRRNGPGALASYGRYLGHRFGAYPNVIWLHGGDHVPDDRDLRLVDAVRDGIIGGGGAGQIHTYHWTTPPAADRRLHRVDLDAIYTYDTGIIGSHVLSAHARNAGHRPFIFLEGAYENEYRSRPMQWREQFYTTMLAGGAGFVFGNYPIWPFWSPGDRRYGFGDDGFPGGWTTALASPGAANLGRAAHFFRSIRWHTLVPDTAGALVTATKRPLGQGIMAAMTADRRLGLVYFGVVERATIDPRALSGRVTARWFDPATGAWMPVREWASQPTTPVDVHTPPRHADGGSDWMLVLASAR